MIVAPAFTHLPVSLQTVVTFDGRWTDVFVLAYRILLFPTLHVVTAPFDVHPFQGPAVSQSRVVTKARPGRVGVPSGLLRDTPKTLMSQPYQKVLSMP